MFESPLFLGFEPLRALAERAAKAEAYPPYNVEDLGEGCLRITLGVAGFTPERLSVTLEGPQLTIVGKREAEAEAREFLHRGIAARSFVRGFVLADGLEVAGAKLVDGLLHIDLHRPTPEARVKVIPIS